MGAAATTTYDVITRYLVDDKGSRPVQHITQQVQTLERTASSSMGLLGKLGGAFAGYLGFQQAKKSLIDFNSNMEQSKITMAGLMEQAGRGNYADNFETASKLVKQMQLDARASIGTTADFVDMASQLIQPLTMAGGSMENLRDMTRQTVVASKSMGIEAGVAARDIDQAIRGQYKSVDPFSGKLLTPLGYGGEEGRKKFNAMSMQARTAEIQRALASPAIAAMAKAQETSFSGASSTLVDNLQMTMGKVGLPLFKSLTVELNKWNTWLDKNQGLVDQIAKDLGGKIVSAAVLFRDAVAFAADHWKSILGTMLAIKGAGSLMTFGQAGLAAEAAWGSATTVAGAQAAANASRMAGIGSAVTIGAITAAALYVGATELTAYIEKRQQLAINQSGTADAALQMMGASGARGGNAFRQYLQGQGLAGESSLNKEAFATMMEQADLRTRGRWADALGLHEKGNSVWHDAQTDPMAIAEAMAKRFGDVLRDAYIMKGGMLQDIQDPWRMPGSVRLPKTEKAKVNVIINRIEVASDDPDRFAFGMVKAFRKAAKDPGGVGSNIHALSEG